MDQQHCWRVWLWSPDSLPTSHLAINAPLLSALCQQWCCQTTYVHPSCRCPRISSQKRLAGSLLGLLSSCCTGNAAHCDTLFAYHAHQWQFSTSLLYPYTEIETRIGLTDACSKRLLLIAASSLPCIAVQQHFNKVFVKNDMFSIWRQS